MQPKILTLEEYIENLARQSPHPDPTVVSQGGLDLKKAAAAFLKLHPVTRESLADFIADNPWAVDALGYTVGLSHEKLKNNLGHILGSAGYIRLAQLRSAELVKYLDEEFSLIPLLNSQLSRSYDFGDVLVARAGSRALAQRATLAGRSLEDEIEGIAKQVGLPYELRGTFIGRNGMSAPFDLAIPGDGSDAEIVVAAKAFDSTGSKLTDAVREIEQMANARRPNQFVMAVVDGIGWRRRRADLARIYDYWSNNAIDGLYTRATLGAFQSDLLEAAGLRKLL